MSNRKNDIKIRIGKYTEGVQTFKAILYHPMETGFRKDKRNGETIPADYIDMFSVSVDGQKQIELTLSENVSKNPYISFAFTRPVTEGQQLNISWVDNNNMRVSHDFVMARGEGGYLRASSVNSSTEIMQITPQTGPVCNDSVKQELNQK